MLNNKPKEETEKKEKETEKDKEKPYVFECYRSPCANCPFSSSWCPDCIYYT